MAMTPASLDGKVAALTGAASDIGLATVERFVEAGAPVVAAGTSFAGPHLKRRGAEPLLPIPLPEIPHAQGHLHRP